MVQLKAAQQALTQRQPGRGRRGQPRSQREQGQRRLQPQQQQILLPNLNATVNHHHKVTPRWRKTLGRSASRRDSQDSDPTGCPKFLCENCGESKLQ